MLEASQPAPGPGELVQSLGRELTDALARDVHVTRAVDMTYVALLGLRAEAKLTRENQRWT